MGIESAVTLLAAIGSFLAIFGAGAKWLLGYMDEKSRDVMASMEAASKESSAKEESARTELYNRLQGEIKNLRDELQRVQKEKSLYLKRIYQLEYFIHTQPGVDIPKMEGWPPI